jgi:hypothetical protein
MNISTVKHVYNDHLWVSQKLVSLQRELLFRVVPQNIEFELIESEFVDDDFIE